MNKEGALKEIKLANSECRRANLIGADLRYANLIGADLRDANLIGADLRGADLRDADLSGADLRDANLRGADLRDANLIGANLPSPTMVLFVWWGTLSNELTLELMRYDAYNHPDPKSFDVWKKTGKCPFANLKVQRAANFCEKKSLWVDWNPRLKVKSAYELMKLVLKEKTKQD